MKRKDKRSIIKSRAPTRAQLLQLDTIDDLQNPLQIPTKTHNWETVETIYRKKLRTLDRDIDKCYDYVKPQANSIYYDRKVEFQNIVDNRKNSLDKNLSNIYKEREKQQQINNYDKGIEKLKSIMVKYDIKHPMRGEDYAELKQKKQPFSNKIIGIVSSGNSYLGYKRDVRSTLEFSEMQSEDYKKKESLKFQKQRTIMKYRLYGIEGVNEREVEKLREWGVVKQHQHLNCQELKKFRFKKRVKKSRVNSEGRSSYYTTDDSRSCEDAYEMRLEIIHQDHEYGSPEDENMGFEIKPLCPTIYGKQAAKNSQLKHFRVQSQLSEKPNYSTLQVSQNFKNKRQSKTRNQRDRTPIQMPELLQSRNGQLNQSYDQMNKGSIDFINSEIRKPRKILMPNLVNRAHLDQSSITELYQNDNDITNLGEAQLSEKFHRGKTQFITKKYTQEKIDTVTDRLSKRQHGHQLEFKSSNVTPRIASQLASYGNKSPLKATVERKTMGNGRLNQMFSDRTPRVTDSDIRSLVSKYPLGEKREAADIPQEQTDNLLSKVMQSQAYKQVYEKNKRFEIPQKGACNERKLNNIKVKQQLEFIGRNINKMQTQSKIYNKELLTKMVLQNFRDEEMLKIQEFIKEIDFAEAENMPKLYDLKMKDEIERLKVIKEVTKDHHEGKLDPGKMGVKNRSKRQKK